MADVGSNRSGISNAGWTTDRWELPCLFLKPSNLMQRDDMSNLGLGDVVDPAAPSPSPSTTTASPSIPSSTTTSASASSLKPAPVDQSRI
ncbi:hypothetical protein I317_01354 [Kwoniella heveanensis CBS 569]|nr:hypothetical protein I317_01354 [Kwoniella heveanensis CBS 569]